LYFIPGKSPFLLEDIEELDNLSEFLNHLPQLSDLMGRLKPKTVQDPFVDKEGNTLCDQLIIRYVTFSVLVISGYICCHSD
jgi:hypothetical protein